jgi:hypothetical protein
MPIRVALAVVVLTAGIASTATAARLEVGQSGYLRTAALVCPTHEIMVKILKLANTDFDAAVARGFGEGCSTLDKGTVVFVAEVPNAVLACVVPKPRTNTCVWTAQGSVVATD